MRGKFTNNILRSSRVLNVRIYSRLKKLLLLFLTLILASCGDDPVDVQNLLPLVSAGEDISIEEQTEITITGLGSDPDGHISDISWQQISGPDVIINEQNSTSITFTTPTVTTSEILIFRITVTDDEGASQYDDVEVTVTAVNLPPVAVAGNDMTVFEQTEVTLNGSGSYDTDGNVSQYYWTQSSGPDLLLANAQTATPAFFSPAVTSSDIQLTLNLQVTDNEEAVSPVSEASAITVTVISNTLPVSSDLNIVATIDTTDIQNQLIANDTDGHPLTFEIIDNPQLGTITSLDPLTGKFSYTPVGETGTDQFTFTAKDYLGNSGVSTVTIEISPVNLTEPANEVALNDDMTTATTVYQNSSMEATLSSAADHDWFSFTAFTTGSIAFSVDVPTSSSDDFFIVTIMDENGEILSEQVTGEDIVIFQSATAGQQFFVQITSATNFDSNEYVLSLENYQSIQATLSWNKPLLNEDESELTDLDHYYIYYDDGSGEFDQKILVEAKEDGIDVEAYEFKHLKPDTLYNFRMTAINSLGTESDYSEPVLNKQFYLD